MDSWHTLSKGTTESLVSECPSKMKMKMSFALLVPLSLIDLMLWESIFLIFPALSIHTM